MDRQEIISDMQGLRVLNKRRIWEPFMRKYDVQRLAEIGVFEGKHFWRLIQHHPQLAVAVDMWLNDGVPAHNDVAYPQEELDRAERQFRAGMRTWPGVEILSLYSEQASWRFPDETFDFVYIDADHTHEGCLNDLRCWYPKVKRSRFLVGDDYRVKTIRRTGVQFGVIEAVADFSMEMHVEFFVLPRYGWGMIKP